MPVGNEELASQVKNAIQKAIDEILDKITTAVTSATLEVEDGDYMPTTACRSQASRNSNVSDEDLSITLLSHPHQPISRMSTS